MKLNIKLSHKWDNPATLGCTIESVKFNSTSIYFEAKWYPLACSFSRSPASKKKFVLNLPLMGKINPEVSAFRLSHTQASNWSEAAVGRVVLNIKKYEAGLWDNVIVVALSGRTDT